MTNVVCPPPVVVFAKEVISKEVKELPLILAVIVPEAAPPPPPPSPPSSSLEQEVKVISEKHINSNVTCFKVLIVEIFLRLIIFQNCELTAWQSIRRITYFLNKVWILNKIGSRV